MSVTGIGSSNSGWDWQAIVKESQQNNQTTGTTDSSDSSGNGGTQSTNPMLASLASVLNLSTSQIQQDLSNGQSLSQIASAQGVSQSTLLSTIESSLQRSPFGSSASSQQISTMASAIANNTGPFPPPPPSSQNSQGTSSGNGQQSAVSDLASDLVINLLQDLSQLAGSQAGSGGSAAGTSNSPGAGGSGDNNPMLSSLTSVLNLSTSQIQQDLSNGQSLSQIASAQGVSAELTSERYRVVPPERSLRIRQSHPTSSPTWRPPSPTTPERSPHHHLRHRTSKPRPPEAISSRPLTNLPPASPTRSYKICPSWPTTKPGMEARVPKREQTAGSPGHLWRRCGRRYGSVQRTIHRKTGTRHHATPENT